MRRAICAVVGAAALSLLPALPAVAHDGDHVPVGASGPALYSENMKLQSNLPKSGTATQSDLAFFGKYAVTGTYTGFRIVDVSEPEAPKVVTDFACNGPQGDVSVMGNLLFQSVDSPRTDPSCTAGAATAATPGMFEGIRVFDISDVAAPKHVASIPTDCGSHTHTLLPEPEKGRAVLYVSSYPLGRAAVGPNCQPAETGDGHDQVSIVEVPVGNPAAATVREYRLDAGTQPATYDLRPNADVYTFRACHDISVFKELRLAAAACMSEGQLWDISDPLAPEFRWRYDNPAVKPERIDLFHSASFSWDGEVVAFGDESGGGGAARCTDPHDQQGRIWFVDTATGAERASFKVPRAEAGTCTMHNFNFVPLRDGRKVLVSSAYTAGTTIVDVDKLMKLTAAGEGHPEHEAELGFYRPTGASTWSSYWYNGRIYGNDIFRGLDIFNYTGRATAGALKLDHLNPQTQLQVIR